jgi:serine/threonine protein kinase
MSFNDLKTLVYQEIAIMNSLIHHPNIITLVGFTEEPLSIVMKMYERTLFSLCMSSPDYAVDSAELESLRHAVKTESRMKKAILVKGT